jgi:hypothetical protein
VAGTFQADAFQSDTFEETTLAALTLDSSAVLPLGTAGAIAVIVAAGSTARLPLGTSAAISVLIAADSSRSLPLSTQGVIAVVVTADASQRLPLGEVAAIAIIDTVGDSEALPLGTIGAAQVLVAIAASKTLPLSTSAAATLPIAVEQSSPLPLATSADGSVLLVLDSAAVLPLGQIVDFGAPLADRTLDASSQLQLRTTATIQTAADAYGSGVGHRQQRSPTKQKRKEIELESSGVVPFRTNGEISVEALPVTKASETKPRVITFPIAKPIATPARVEIEATPEPGKAKPVRRPIGSRLLSVAQLPLKTEVAVRVLPFVAPTESIARFNDNTPKPPIVEEPTLPARALESRGILPFRTTGRLSVQPLSLDETEDDDLTAILLAYELMDAA